MRLRNKFGSTLLAGMLLTLSAVEGRAADPEAGQPPAVGDSAPDLNLKRLDGETVVLSRLTEQTQVVVIFLRGYPGYQCPVCSKQVGRFLSSGSKLKDAGAQVVLVYPGQAAELAQRAEEFSHDWMLPAHFQFVLDPDYEATNAWHLRWDAPRETAFPSTFVVGQDGKVRFAKVSMTHGGRASVEDVLGALQK